jgi:hypothetical protein
MKHKHFQFRILPSLVLLMVFHHDILCGQTLDDCPGPVFMRTAKTMDFIRIAKTSDILYFNDTTYYLMDESPLAVFPDYRDLYHSYDKVNRNVDFQKVGNSMISPYRSLMKYYVVWFLKNSRLYMGEIKFFALLFNNEDDEVFPHGEQYKLMEKMTGQRFDRKIRSTMNRDIGHSLGAMPAVWFSDTIIVKQAEKLEGTISKWSQIPCHELIFKNGKLISVRIKENMN